MTRLAVMTTERPAPSFGQVLDGVLALGLDCVQLQLGSVLPQVPTTDALLRGLDVLGPLLTPDLVRTAAEALDERGITVAAVDGTYNMIDTDRERRARNLGHLTTLIELAPVLGTDLVTLCTGTRAEIMWSWDDQNGSDEAWADLVEQVTAAARVAAAVGVRLAFEPEHNNVVDSAERARRLIDEVGSPALTVLMDAANLFHHGDLDRQHDHLKQAFALVGDDITLAHAKDLDHDGDAGHRAAGRGLLDYRHYLALLQESGFDGAVVLHQLGELAPDRLAEAVAYVRAQAPAGYLV